MRTLDAEVNDLDGCFEKLTDEKAIEFAAGGYAQIECEGEIIECELTYDEKGKPHVTTIGL